MANISKSENYNPLKAKTKEYIEGWDHIFKPTKVKKGKPKKDVD